MRPQVRINREATRHEFGTLGTLLVNNIPFCCTVEPPDKHNAKNISSIPAGQYTCRRYSSKKYPNAFEVMNVPDRTDVLFHAGNTKADTAGCILLGQYWAKLLGNIAALNSGKTFKEFMVLMRDYKVFDLTINEVY